MRVSYIRVPDKGFWIMIIVGRYNASIYILYYIRIGTYITTTATAGWRAHRKG